MQVLVGAFPVTGAVAGQEQLCPFEVGARGEERCRYRFVDGQGVGKVGLGLIETPEDRGQCPEVMGDQ